MIAKIAVETFPGEPGKYFTRYVSQVCDLKSNLSSQLWPRVEYLCMKYICVSLYSQHCSLRHKYQSQDSIECYTLRKIMDTLSSPKLT